MIYPMTYVYLACFTAQTITATLLLVAIPHQPIRRPLAGVVALSALWALADMLHNLATTSEQMRLLHYVFVPVWTLLPYFMLRAALIYAGHRKIVLAVSWNALLVVPTLFFCWLAWNDRLFIDFVPAGVRANYFHIGLSHWQPLVDCHFVGYALAGGIAVLHAAHRTSRVAFQSTRRLLLWSVLPTIMIGLLFNGGLFFTDVFTPYVSSVVVAAGTAVVVVGVLRREFLTPLFEAQRDYQTLLKTSPDGITITDMAGRFVMVNPRAVEAVGYDSVDTLLAECPDSLGCIAPEDQPLARQVMQNVINHVGVQRFTHDLVRRDGSRLPVEASIALLRNEASEPQGMISTLRDLSDREKAESERRRLEAQVQHRQKLESLGVMAGGIAHDFNNLLVGILGNANLLMGEVADEAARARLRQIETAAQRANVLTTEMLAYAGRSRFVVEPLDLSHLVNEIGQLLAVSIPKNIQLTCDFASPLPMITADAAQLQQVIMNLITNAAEAIGKRGGSIRLQTRLSVVTEGELIDRATSDPVPAGTYVCLSVTDDGCGMSDETLRNIFDPFFTTKFAGRGLGMAVVHGIVRSHHGALVVDTEPDRGTTIHVLLPVPQVATSSLPKRLTPLPPVQDPWRGCGTVLVIDDEELVREVVGATVRQAGFTVLAAADGVAGVALHRDNADSVVVAVIDLTMPRMGGREAYDHIRALRPDLPVIIISGYAEEETTALFPTNGPTGFLQKPFVPIQLLAAIRERMEACARDAEQAQLAVSS